MIIDKLKSMRKLGILLLALWLLALTLVSCQTGKKNEPPFELLKESEESLSGCTLVIPTYCSSSLRAEASVLAEEITRQTGLSTRVRYDEERWIKQEGDLLVLLGAVDHADMRDALNGLKAKDYLCRGMGTALLLGGKSDEATVLAIRRFREELLPHATASCLISPEAGFTVYGTYEIGSIDLNGFDLNEYTIVYSEKQSETLRELTEELQRLLAEKSGYYLTIQTEEAFKDRGRRILLSLRSSEEHPLSACVIPEDTGVTLSAEDPFGVSVAAEKLLDMLTESTAVGEHRVTLNVTEVIPYECVGARLASVCTTELSLLMPSSLANTLSPIRSRQPQIVFFHGVSDERERLLTENLADYSAIAEDGAVTLRRDNASLLWDDSLGAYRVGDEKRGFLILLCQEETLLEETLRSLTEKSSLPILVLCHGRGEGELLKLPDPLGIRGAFHWSYQTKKGDVNHIACYATDGAFFLERGELVEDVGYVDLTIERKSVFH